MDFENFTQVLQVFKVTVIDIEIISFLTLVDHALTIYHLLENGLDTKEIDWMDLNKLRKTGSIY